MAGRMIGPQIVTNFHKLVCVGCVQSRGESLLFLAVER